MVVKKSMTCNLTSKNGLLIAGIILLIVAAVMLANEYSKNTKKIVENMNVVLQSPDNYTFGYSNVYKDAIAKTPQELNALDRVFTPTRFPYRSSPFYEQVNYPNLSIPNVTALGCGGRAAPCYGGSQVAISSNPPPIRVDNNSIAPVYFTTRGPLGKPQQVGLLYKLFGNSNDVYPLFGRKKYPNGTEWEYYTIMGDYDTKIPVIAKSRYEELGTNDIVKLSLAGNNEKYRVTIYESDFPQYIPYA